MCITKQELIDEFFTYQNPVETKNIDARVKRLRAYISDHEYDSDIENMLRMIEVDRISYKTNDIKKCMSMALPTFDLLKEPKCNDLSFVEVAVLAKLITYAPTFEMLKVCEKIIEDYLENKYQHEITLNSIKFTLSGNILPRLTMAKYFTADGAESEVNRNEILAVFKKHIDFCNHVFSKNKLPRHKAWVKFQEGMFYKNVQLIEDGLIWLRENSLKTWYKTMREEFINFHHHMEDELTPALLDIINSYYVTKICKEKKVEREEVAEYLGLSVDYVAQLETGKRGLTKKNLFKLTHLLDVDMSAFFGKRLKK